MLKHFGRNIQRSLIALTIVIAAISATNISAQAASDRDKAAAAAGAIVGGIIGYKLYKDRKDTRKSSHHSRKNHYYGKRHNNQIRHYGHSHRHNRYDGHTHRRHHQHRRYR